MCSVISLLVTRLGAKAVGTEAGRRAWCEKGDASVELELNSFSVSVNLKQLVGRVDFDYCCQFLSAAEY
jgi:hypothetical protein